MKLPLSLIKKFIDLDQSVEIIASVLTKAGVEVDGIENASPPFSNVVAAKIVSKKEHPDADKLSILEVHDGTQILEIVCGASNCHENMHVALAKVGATLIDETGKEWKIKKSRIRGQVSFGMLCSKQELQISKDHEKILELPEDIELGTDLIDILWDPVFDLSLTPNLGHCFSAIGIARELSCYLNKPLKNKAFLIQENLQKSINESISVKISSQYCNRYSLRLLKNITVCPSPFWLQLVLERASIRSINNVVDITNLVMLELGQPLHAFDYDLIEGKNIEVTDQQEKEEFFALDKTNRILPDNSCIIRDSNKALAIGGIIGGDSSAVSTNTTSVLLEAASFDSVNIRNTARQLGLRTDSAQRFEKTIDSQITTHALDLACYYLQTLFGATVAKNTLDIVKKPYVPKTISVSSHRTSALLGKTLTKLEIEEILKKLHLPFTEKEDVFLIKIPSFRNDLNIEEDLIEEIAKVYGYDNLKGVKPLYSTSNIPDSPMYLFENKIRTLLVGQGLNEFLTCDLISPKLKNLIHEKNIPDSAIIEVMHAKSIDYSFLRPSLLPGLLQSVSHNYSFKNKDIRAFEIGKAHLKDASILEPTLFSIIQSGKTSSHWDRKEQPLDYYDLKGVLENVFESLKVKTTFKPSDHPSFHPHRQAEIFLDDQFSGTMGQVHPNLCKQLDIKEEVYFAEVDMDTLLEKYQEKKLFEKLSTQPSSERDLTLTLDRKVLMKDIFDKIDQSSPDILEKAYITDLFEGEKIGKEKKNITIRFVYRDPIRTLSFEEVEKAHQELIKTISCDIS